MKKPIAAGQRIVAQWITTSATGSPVYGPVSEAAIAGECDRDAVDSTIGAPTLDAIKKGDTAFSGRAPKDVTGSVRICVDGFQSGAPAQIGGGAFSGVPIPTLAAGSVVVAQAIESKKYGRFSDVVVTGTCSSAITDLQVGEPTLASVPAPGGDSVTGTVPLSKDGIPTATFVRICLDSHSVANEQPNDLEVAVAEVDSNGNFRASLPAAVKGGNSLVAQGFTTSFNGQARKYGLPIESKDVGPRFNGPFSSFIAGAEQSAYSSDDIETNAFVSAFIRSGYLGSKHGSWSLWGRVRLLSAPQQSAPNIVATIANPTGQITQSSLSSVGAVTDYVLGPEWRLRQHDGPAYTTRFSLIGDLGETTPLSTANPTIFNAPAPNTTDCANLIGNINQMSSPPPLTSGNGLTPPTCLENPASQMPYNYVAYTQQKRSGFLAKYGAGVRFSQVSLPKTAGPSPYAGMLDATLGQDDTITGGKLHKLVFRLDGQYPIPLGTLSSYLYIFGSSSIKIAPNKDLPTINLGVVQSNVPTIPNPQVLVLPTQQPDRDFYRLGVGLNLMDVFCKVFNTPCNSQQSQTATAASTPAATKPLAGGTGAAQPAAGSTKGAKGGAKDAGNSNPAQ